MRGNTVPPPSVRLGAEPRPENDPISTSRPRNEDETIPKLGRPPADLIDAARRPEVEATTKTPPVVVSPAPSPIPPPREPLPTLLSAQQRAVEEDDEPPASLAPKSMNGAGVRRSKRGSNLRGRSVPPPSMTSSPPQASEPKAVPQATSVVAQEASKADAGIDAPSEEGVKEHAPASAIPHSDLDHPGFFDRAEDGSELSDLDGYDERMAHKNTPAAIAAREKNWKYIKVIGGVCVFLMVAGLVRSKLAPVEEPTSISPPVIVAPPPPSAPPALANVDTPAPPASVSPGAAGSAAAGGSAIPVASAEDLPPAAGSAKVEEGTKPGDVPIVVAPPPGPAAEPTDAEKKSAVQEKHASQAFLDQGAFAKAVEAGEKSVALDPSDGEAWLMLGAAYQSMGKAAEARRSFSSCVQEGKKGPINECRAMLR